jgi:hypothetical protein
MKAAFTWQYRHLWRTFDRIVRDFRDPAWTAGGFGLTTPARLAYHILESTRYYIADSEPLMFRNGKAMTARSKDIGESELPTREDILFLIGSMAAKTGRWIEGLDLDAKNPDYPWAGDTKGSVALFVIRHSQYHLGELDALLNEQEKGKARDHFADSVADSAAD